MKRLIIALAIFISGTGLFCASHPSSMMLRRQVEETRLAWMAQTQRLAQARIQLAEADESLRLLKQSPEPLESTPRSQVPESLLSTIHSSHLSAAQAEDLLADLDFNWNTTGAYLIVTKDTLRAISLKALKGMRLDDTAYNVLAITPDERARIDALTQSLGDAYKAWAEARLRREKLGSDEVVAFTIPEDPSFSQSFSNQFTTGLLSVLGKERGELLQGYSESWLGSLGMAGGGDTSFVVKRYQAGNQPRLSFAIRSHGNAFGTDVAPEQPFPEAFLPLFPNGWSDLAKREGFEMPKRSYPIMR